MGLDGHGHNCRPVSGPDSVRLSDQVGFHRVRHVPLGFLVGRLHLRNHSLCFLADWQVEPQNFSIFQKVTESCTYNSDLNLKVFFQAHPQCSLVWTDSLGFLRVLGLWHPEDLGRKEALALRSGLRPNFFPVCFYQKMNADLLGRTLVLLVPTSNSFVFFQTLAHSNIPTLLYLPWGKN